MSIFKRRKDLEKRVEVLEKDVRKLKGFLGYIEPKRPDVCPECGEEGKVESTDEYSKRRYIHYRCSKDHSWFEEEEIKA